MHERAADIGRLRGERLISEDSLRALCHMMSEEQTQVDQDGLATRLIFTARASAEARAKAVWDAHNRVRRAVRPLLDNPDVPKGVVEEAAGDAADGDLDWKDIFRILRDEVILRDSRTRYRVPVR